MIQVLASPFFVIIKRIKRNRLRQIMRGYQNLRRSDRLARIAEVKQTLTERRLLSLEKQPLPSLEGCNSVSAELVIRQYLLARVGGIDLNRALLLASGKINGQVVFPLPLEWREIIAKHGFKVANFRSAIVWQLYIVAFLFYGVVKIGQIILAGMTASNHSKRQPVRYAFFVDLGPGNLPHESLGKRSYDVISWYLQWRGRRRDIQAVRHSCVASVGSVFRAVEGTDIVFQPKPLPALVGVREVAQYVSWAVPAISTAAIEFILGRWWSAFLLSQSALTAQARILPQNLLAKEYLFHNSGWIYRPMWTYEAERRGSEIYFYFYSTNCESFKQKYAYPPMPYGWGAMSWSRYIVWDKYQNEFVRRAVGDSANVIVAGSIWFSDSRAQLPYLDGSCVAVFDVTPHRFSRYCTLGMETEYYVPSVAIPFLENASDVIRQCGLKMLWKRKRNIENLAHPYYRNFAHLLAESDHVISVEPEISAIRAIEASVCVISMPFTSTALVAREMGVPSVYFDSSALLQPDDRAAHGIPIVSNPKDLEQWLSVNVKVKPQY